MELRAGLRSVLGVVGKLCYLAAGLSFWVGGRAIHEFAGTDRIVAEFWGIALAVGLGLMGVLIQGFSGDRP
jgi:hypothetical protein